MTFDHLTDGEFEELTYDLLSTLGMSNLSWRRGSGMGGATADQGRDIVGDRLERDVDGHERLERWFVQCKRYERGVPPEKLQGAIAWATSERPSVLLFAVSNFLSNPAKTWLENYQRENRPSFRIKVWERTDLERFVSSRSELARKYRLDVGVALHTVHPAHLRYMLEPCFNTVEYFFRVLDTVEPQMRDQILDFGYMWVINPRFREPRTGNEPLGDLLIDKVDYSAFRLKCHNLVRGRHLSENFLVQSLVSNALAWAWRFSDTAQLEGVMQRQRDASAYVSQKLKTETDPTRRATLEKMREMTERMTAEAPERRVAAERRYRSFCDNVLPLLYLEESKWLANLPDRSTQ